MKIEGKKLLLALVIPLGVGGLSAWVTRDAMEQYGGLSSRRLHRPAGSSRWCGAYCSS